MRLFPLAMLAAVAGLAATALAAQLNTTANPTEGTADTGPTAVLESTGDTGPTAVTGPTADTDTTIFDNRNVVDTPIPSTAPVDPDTGGDVLDGEAEISTGATIEVLEEDDESDSDSPR